MIRSILLRLLTGLYLAYNCCASVGPFFTVEVTDDSDSASNLSESKSQGTIQSKGSFGTSRTEVNVLETKKTGTAYRSFTGSALGRRRTLGIILCHQSCLTCDGTTDQDCLSCPAGAVLSSRRCYLCHPTCQSCLETAAPFCSSCSPPLVFTPWDSDSSSQYICQTQLAGTYLDSHNAQRFCHPNCSTCTNATSCITCKPGRHKLENTDLCVECDLATALSGYYYDVGTDLCRQCDGNCTSCLSGATTCTECSSVAFEVSRLDNTCVPQNILADGSYFDSTYSSTYLQCDANCRRCSPHAPDRCLRCYSGYLLMPNATCATSCPTGYTENTMYGTCDMCMWPCLTCSITSRNCTNCVEGLLLGLAYGGIQNCSFLGGGYYVQTGTSTLLSCSSQCTGRCDPSNSSKCLACNPDTYSGGYMYPSATNWTCAACGDGFAKVSNGLCVPCDSSCTRCGIWQNFCTGCPALYILDATLGRCVTSYPNGTYANITTAVFARCNKGCLACSANSSYCSTCMPEYFLNANHTCARADSMSYLNSSSLLGRCPDNCLLCSNSGECLQCASGTYWNSTQGSCDSTCSASSTILKTRCMKCSGMCKTCDLSENHCATCPNDTYLLQGTQNCVPCKASGQFLGAGNVCNNCSQACHTCSMVADNCTSCLPPKEPILGTGGKYSCENIPGSNYYLTTPARFLSQCDPTICGTCDTSATNCGECSNSLYKAAYPLTTDPVCVGCSASGYLASGKLCYKCSSSCATCSSSPYLCDTCATGKFKLPNGSCSPCYTWSGYYKTSANLCEKCSINCKTCSGTATTCTACQTGWFLSVSSSTCSYCPDGTFYSSGLNKCQTCDANCKTCMSSGINCTSCSSPMYLRSDTNTCSSCGPGYIHDSDGRCLKCDGSCAACAGLTDICTVCNSGQYLRSDKKCVDCLEDGWYISGASCEVCHQSCKTCSGSGSSNCLTCYTGFTISYDSCVSTHACASKQFFSSLNNTCEDCDSNCATCADKSTQCTSCTSGLLLGAVNSTCSTCGEGFYLGPDNKCYECSSSCMTCSIRATQCMSCATGEYFFAATKTCGLCSGSWYTAGTSCLRCHKSCLTCNGPLSSDCTSCYSGLSFKIGSSVCEECLQGYYIDSTDGKCKPCNSNCRTCVGSPTNCTSCDNITSVLNDTSKVCVSSCASGYFKSFDNACYACDSACLTCAESSTRCLTCKVGFYFSEINSTCSACGSGYYVDGLSCRVCSQQCRSCRSNSTNCTGCVVGQFLNVTSGNGICLSSCPSGQFIDVVDGFCKPCDSNCEQCFKVSTNCTQCAVPAVLSDTNRTCGSCGVGFFIQQNGTCSQCDPNCPTCEKSKTSCTSCTSGSYLSAENGTCSSCGTGYYAIGTICYKCVFPCSTCSSVSVCLSCSDGLYLHANSSNCSSCLTGNYLNATDNKCYSCNTTNCYSCFGDPNNCTSCSSSSYLDTETNSATIKYLSVGNHSCYKCQAGFSMRRNKCYTSESTCSLSASDYTKCIADRVTGPTVANTTGRQGRSVFDLSQWIECQSGWYIAYNTVCLKCSTNCTTCGPNGDQCLTCQPGYAVHYKSKKCELIVDGTFVSTDGSLQECNETCATCSGTATHCTSGEESSGYYTLPDSTVGPVPDGMIYIDGAFVNCDPSCVTCKWSPTSCRSCQAGMLLDESDYSCVAPKTGWLDFDNTTRRCAANCAACSMSENNCTACHKGYYIKQVSGKQRCIAVDDTLYVDSSEAMQDCNANCATCAGSSASCTSCVAGLSLSSSSTCVNCDTSSNYLLLRNICFSCHSSCKRCSVSAPNCIECFAGSYLLESGTCGACPSDHFVSGSLCLKCSEGCLSCTDSTNCSTCDPEYTLVANMCTPNCSKGSYLSTVTNSCELCSPNCRECHGSASTCTSCFAGVFLSSSNSTCDSCGNGFFYRDDKCRQCDSNCLTCDLVASKCLTCSTGNYLSADHSCSTCAVQGYYVSLSGLCERCPIGCKVCSPSTGECTECHKGYFISSYGGATCQKLTAGYFVDLMDSKLYKCSPKCGTCAINSTYCTGCDNDDAFWPADGSCVLCPEGYFHKHGECRKCESFCRTCANNSWSCMTCYAGKYLSEDNSTCTSCNSNTFYKSLSVGVCRHCPSTCKTCDEFSGQCIDCANGMIPMYDRPQCTVCSDGMYRNSTDNKCYFCDISCAGCFGEPTNCTKCTNSFLSITNGTCGMCGPGYFHSGDYCYQCDSSCVECEDFPHQCTICPAGKLLLQTNGTCVDYCVAEHFITPNNECAPCAENCTLCTNYTGQCTACTAGMFVLATTRNCTECRESEGYYLNHANNMCYKCPDSCNACQYRTNGTVVCTSCPQYYFASSINGSCTPCGGGHFVEDSSQLCKPCASPCSTCSGRAEQCLSCAAGYYYSTLNYSCVPVCGAGFFLDSYNNCLPCESNCTKCVSPYGLCQECRPGLVVANLTYLTYCVSACPQGWFLHPSLNQCFACNSNCSACSMTANNCTSCLVTNSKMFLSVANNTCDACDSGYFQSTSSGKCFKCHSNCSSCSSSANDVCTACISSKYLVASSWDQCQAVMPNRTYLLATAAPSLCDPNCLQCSFNSTLCTKCESWLVLSASNRTCGACGSGYYVAADGMCYLCSSSCLECQGTGTFCTSCERGLFISSTVAGSCVVCAAGNTVTPDGKCTSCSSNCSTCAHQPGSCTSCGPSDQFVSSINKTCDVCGTDFYVSSIDNRCYPKDCSRIDGWYRSGYLCLPCDPSCRKCSGGAANQCTLCDTTTRYFLNSTCYALSDLSMQLVSTSGGKLSADKFDWSFTLTAYNTTFRKNEDASLTFWKTLLESIQITVQMSSQEGDKTIPLKVQTALLSSGEGIGVYLYFLEQPVLATYSIKTSWKLELSSFAWDGLDYRLTEGSNSTIWSNPISTELLQQATQQGELAGALSSVGESFVGSKTTAFLGVLMAGDPTGIFTKFSQTIKIVSKLLYLNVPYGSILKLFLETSDKQSKTLRESSYQDQSLKTNSYRGRLSTYKVLVNAEEGMALKILLYCGSWMLRLTHSWIIAREIHIPKYALYVLYFGPKVHIVLYNTIVIDFCFYMSRTLLHSTSALNRLAAFVILILVVIDILTIADLVWRDEPWLYAYRMKRLERHYREQLLQLAKEHKSFGKITSVKSPVKKKGAESAWAFDLAEMMTPKNKEKHVVVGIDYYKTYREINYNAHLMEMIASVLVEKKEVLNSVGCKAHFLIHSVRVVLYQFILVSNQSSNLLAVTCLWCMELGKIVTTLRLYITMRHYDGFVHFLADISQSCFLLVFLSETFVFTQVDVVSYKMQVVAIYVVVLSCIFEYVLSLIFVGSIIIAFVSFYLKTKAVKKYVPKPVQQMFSFIKYKTVEVFEFEPDKLGLHEVSEKQGDVRKIHFIKPGTNFLRNSTNRIKFKKGDTKEQHSILGDAETVRATPIQTPLTASKPQSIKSGKAKKYNKVTQSKASLSSYEDIGTSKLSSAPYPLKDDEEKDASAGVPRLSLFGKSSLTRLVSQNQKPPSSLQIMPHLVMDRDQADTAQNITPPVAVTKKSEFKILTVSPKKVKSSRLLKQGLTKSNRSVQGNFATPSISASTSQLIPLEDNVPVEVNDSKLEASHVQLLHPDREQKVQETDKAYSRKQSATIKNPSERNIKAVASPVDDLKHENPVTTGVVDTEMIVLRTPEIGNEWPSRRARANQQQDIRLKTPSFSEPLKDQGHDSVL